MRGAIMRGTSTATTSAVLRAATMRVAAIVAALGIATAAAPAGAQQPAAEPVKWDQARVTQYAVELTSAIGAAVQELRKSPLQSAPQQRTVWFEMKEDLRLLQATASHLQTELQAGASQEETAATFKRIESLRHDAEEIGRKSMIPAPVMDALVKAGSIHNRMRPYYFGKN